jgi:hypothetical protein
VVECLPSKLKAIISNHSTPEKRGEGEKSKKKEKKKES